MDIDRIVTETHKNMSMNKINDKLYLSNNQIDVLDRYNINIMELSYMNVKKIQLVNLFMNYS